MLKFTERTKTPGDDFKKNIAFPEGRSLKFEDKILINNIIFIDNQLIIYNYQYLRIGLSFGPIFTSMIQSHLQLINYLSLHTDLTHMEET